ncbi:MAG: carboxypeptidase regulatory-like domain-containing protein, partial [Pyrinomonadaceae bacterium]
MTHSQPNTPEAFICRAASLLLCASLLISLTPATARAQTAATGAVAGRVVDPTGAVVSGAQVELTNAATGQSQKQLSNSSGQYAFTQLAPGEYGLAVSARGFRKTSIADIKIEVTKTHNVDLTLEVGDVAESVSVGAVAGVELQKTDAAIGNVIPTKPLAALPSLERSAVEFLTLQPGTSPEAGDGDNGSGGGVVAGARSDQSTFSVDGIDVTENSTGGGAGFRTIIPVPVESVEEFRGGVLNLGASFARGAGGQVALVGRRGSNEFHGAGYYYHQNDDLNANSWTNNRNGIEKAEQRDNRYGFRLGAPLWRDHTFFFTNYEGRNFARAFDVLRIVPTDTLRRGVVRLRDNAGRAVSYDLATSTLCGAAGATRCDPRRLGLSPAVSALWSLLPQGNDASSGDGLNTIGWRATASTPLESDYFVARLDHTLRANWTLDASATYFRRLSTLGGSTSLRQQLDIRGGKAAFTSNTPQRGQTFTLGVTGLVAPNFVNTFRLGWTRDRQSNQPLSPSAVAALLNIPGTASGAGNVALNIGGGSLDQLVSEPIDVDVQRARAQVNDNEPLQFVYDGSWLRGTHAFQFGANFRHILTRHTRNDKSVGSLTTPVADIFRGSNISIPNTSRPPTCSSSAQTNCLQSTDVAQWDTLFAAVTGMIDTVGVLAVRDANLNAQPFGTPLRAEATNNTYDFYFEDKWQARPSLSLSLGLGYGWQSPPTERTGRQTIMINNETGEPLTYRNYIEPRRQAALAGQIYNPQIAFVPLASSGRDQVFDTDRNNFSPRLAAAWNPTFEGGRFGKLFGARKTVLRGGFGIVYDRINTSESVIIPSLGVGFSQTVTRRAPLCNSTSAGGANCNAAATSPASIFRVGVDGAIPLPVVASAVGVPIVPTQPFGESISFQIDPGFKVGENYTFDLTVQRELPGKMILEVGWLARLGRHLPTNVNFNSAPFFQVDAASGQTFAQAFDNVARLLRAGAAAASVPAQAWFQNNMPGGTARVLTGNEANFINGNVSGIFQTI